MFNSKRARAHYCQRNTWGVRGVRGYIKRVEDYTAGGGETCFSRQFVQKNINHTYGDSSDTASSYACMKDTSLALSLSKGMLGMITRKGCAHIENNYGATTDLHNIPHLSILLFHKFTELMSLSGSAKLCNILNTFLFESYMH